MPELPEVEIVKQSLQKSINLRKIVKVVVNNRNLRFKIEKDFEKNIKNKVIKNVSRKAKYLIIELENDKYFIIHFGMSGTLHLIKKNKKQKRTNLSFYHSNILGKKHNHVLLFFDKFKIIFNDPRRFGFFKFFKNRSTLQKYLSKNGEEPLSPLFNLSYLKKNILSRKKNIKNILLDQKIVSGIGNIYASEILFYSCVHPMKLGNEISIIELKKILKYSKFVLRKAIKNGGSSIRDFKNTDGNEGYYQQKFKVYNKENETCPNMLCISKITKRVISNRSTFFCGNCQK